MVIDRSRLRRQERKLFERLEAALPVGESLLAAALVFTGPEPNLFGLVEDVLSQDMYLGFANRRKYFTLIVTDRRVILAENVGEKTPMHVRHQYEGASAIEDASTVEGDTWVRLDSHKYWFWPDWTAQISEMQRLSARR